MHQLLTYSTSSDIKLPQSSFDKTPNQAHRSNKSLKAKILKKTNFDPFPKSTLMSQVHTQGSPCPSFDLTHINRNLTPIFKTSTSSFPYFIQEPLKKSKLLIIDKKKKSLVGESKQNLNLIGKTLNGSQQKNNKANSLSKKGIRSKGEIKYANKSYFKNDMQLPKNDEIRKKILISNKNSLPAIHKSTSFQGLLAKLKNKELKPQLEENHNKKVNVKNKLQFSMTIKGWDVDIRP